MNRKEKILLNFIFSDLNIVKESSYHALKALEKKHPGNIEIKRGLYKHFKQRGDEHKAMYILSKIVATNPNKDDLEQLILLSFKNNAFPLIFDTLKIGNKIQNFEFLNNVVYILKNKDFEIDFQYLLLENRTLKHNNGSLNHHYKNPSIDYSYSFSQKYTMLLQFIQQKNVVDAFSLMFSLFKCKDYCSTIEFLVKSQRIELLYHLSENFSFFTKYFEESLKTIRNELILVLELLLKIEKIEMIEDFALLFKYKQPEERPKCSKDF